MASLSVRRLDGEVIRRLKIRAQRDGLSVEETVRRILERIVPFDVQAAAESARLRAERRRAGSPMSLADSQIAGTARSRGYSLATLNTSDFRDLDLSVLEPR